LSSNKNIPNIDKDYVSVVYNETDRPFTQYPDLLAKYLTTRFRLEVNYQLLEVGCGRGDFLRGFIRCGLNCYGVDQSEVARKICPEAEIVQADIEKGLPYNDDRFDVIYSKSVVEHFYHPEKLISEMHRVLKPGGIIITLTPAWEYVYKIFFDDWTHRSPFTKISLRNIFKMHNFQEVKSEYFYQLPIVWKNPWLKPVSQFIGLVTPWTMGNSNKLVRFSKEVMLLASAVKPAIETRSVKP
jgi:ubiquinone/menaquinone biosynthesis C-methylase UbiE